MDYKGNLKGDVLKHYKWKGRRKSTNVMKGGNPNGRRRVELKKEQQKEQQKKREIEMARQYRLEQKRITREEKRAREEERRHAKESEMKRREEKERFRRELEERNRALVREGEIERKKNIAEKARKKQGTVKVKAFVRKLANGKVIQIRSFLRRLVKKISK